MNRKQAKEVSQPFMIIGLVAMLVFSIVILWFSLYAGIAAVIITAGVYIFHLKFTTDYVEKSFDKFKKKALKEREDYMDSFSENAPLLICVATRNARITWQNPAFGNAYESSEALKQYMDEKNMLPFFSEEQKTVTANIGEKTYSVSACDISSNVSGKKMFFFEDVTETAALRKFAEDTKPCVAHINVDNYNDIIEASPLEEQSSIAAQLDRTVHNWALGMKAALIRSRADRYIMIFENKDLMALQAEGFPVLNTVHDIETKAEFPASLSIGISVGENSLEELQQAAASALDLALGRGGDQAVVRVAGGGTKYYGGSLPSVEKRSKNKSLAMSRRLSGLIEASSDVMVMGHARPDMDSYGASLGICALARNLGKKASVVLEEPGEGIELIYKAAFEDKDKDEPENISFLTHEQAFHDITDDTLVIMVDHHRASITEYPQLLAVTKKLAVIDHHRKANDAVEAAALSYMETYASSTSELVSEMLSYAGNKDIISKYEAETLLAGITLDTKNFTVSTGVRTFEAASWLRRRGADSAIVKNYFKVSFDFYRKKMMLISAAEVLWNGVAVAYTREPDPGIQVLISQVADELLGMENVKASVVAGRGESGTLISARSGGAINVQLIMEQMGGGGHLHMAGAQSNLSPEEAIAQVVKIMRDTNVN